MGKRTLIVVGLIGLLVFISGGMKTDPGQKGFDRPGRKEPPEYNCLKHAVDNICEVPMENGKTVLYCTKGIKRIVHYREDCK